MAQRRDEHERDGAGWGSGRTGEGRRERANDRGRARDQGLAGASYGSNERDQTRSREQVRGQPIDEAGEIPSDDADVEAGISRHAERYED
jgi:hypothetical protein